MITWSEGVLVFHMKPFLAEPSYPMQYFRPEVEKTKQNKPTRCQIQILRCEANWNGRKILIAIFIKYEIWEITDPEKPRKRSRTSVCRSSEHQLKMPRTISGVKKVSSMENKPVKGRFSSWASRSQMQGENSVPYASLFTLNETNHI